MVTALVSEPYSKVSPDSADEGQSPVLAKETFWSGPILSVTALAASVLYVLQTFTPLRLTTDGIYYMGFADACARNGGWNAFIHQYFLLPKGYPAFLLALLQTGNLRSATIVGANVVFFALALVFSFLTLVALEVSRKDALAYCVLTLLSFTAIKHVTQAMSDFLFFALAACACWCLTLVDWRKWFALIPALLATEVRLLGLALFVPIAYLAWLRVTKRPKLVVPVAMALLVCVIAGVWAGRRYFLLNVSMMKEFGFGHFVFQAVGLHIRDMGELIANVPLAKFPVSFRPLVMTIGAGALFFLAAGALAIRRRSGWLSSYLIGFSLILPWPFADPRFWLPAMPLLLFAVHSGVRHLISKMPHAIFVSYSIVFCILGFAALGYSTWLTFSGPQFAYRYGDGKLRSTYLNGCGAPGPDVNMDALNLLRRYQWHCDEQP